MLNDKEATELISKSLRYRLTEEEASEVEEHLEQNMESRRFERMSRLIQDSVSDVARLAEEGEPDIAPGLSVEAKARLKSSVREAILHDSQVHTDTPAPDRPGDRTILAPNPDSLFAPQPTESRQMRSRFSIARKLGEGGLGTVWLAKDERLKRNVALKEMSPLAMESPVAWHRFHREAEITGLLEHPGIVPLYQYGIDDSTQQPFYAMRFVGKRTLADAIVEFFERKESGHCDPILLHRLLGNFLRVCEAIAYAHSRGVIHRDLKPENIAIDNFGQVIVLDWGLAKILDTAELGTQLLMSDDISDSALAQTMAGEAIGTPLYMAPEQAAGELDDIDERTDIYGLGAILFSILTGCAPHENSMRSSGENLKIQEVLRKIATGETPSPRDYMPCVPRELEAICLKAMARRRFARFDSATELADAVERWMAGQSDKAARYESLRMEGRELRADFQARVDDLESNVRFAAALPPVQELIRPDGAEDDALWRERMASILIGLLGAKSLFTKVVFSRVDGDQFTELVRVERHSRERSKIRKVPKSRLRSGAVNEFIQKIMVQQPDEVISSLVCNPLCEKEVCREPRLVAGVPVYDDETEEPFGMIMIDCDLRAIFESQMTRRRDVHEIVVACDTHQVMMRNVENTMVNDQLGEPVADVSPHFVESVEALQTQLEYLDENNHNVYGARLWLINNVHGLMYLLRLSDQ